MLIIKITLYPRLLRQMVSLSMSVSWCSNYGLTVHRTVIRYDMWHPAQWFILIRVDLAVNCLCKP